MEYALIRSITHTGPRDTQLTIGIKNNGSLQSSIDEPLTEAT